MSLAENGTISNSSITVDMYGKQAVKLLVFVVKTSLMLFYSYLLILSCSRYRKWGPSMHSIVDIQLTISDTAEPFLMMKEGLNPKGNKFTGNERYEGYCVDLAKKVCQYLGIEYRIQLVKDGSYGRPTLNNNTKQKTWDGMIGEILNDKAHIAIAPLTINSEREEYVDFSKPFMDVGLTIMIKEPEKKKPGVFSFMQPFTIDLWLSILGGYISVGLGIFFVSRFSSAEWRQSRMNKNVTYNKFTFANSLWFAMGSLMLQGSDETCPRSASGRIIGGAWWFGVLIVISSYTANLAAFLTIEKLLTPIESADDLIRQSDISYGILETGSTYEFFKKSRVPTYHTMYSYMKSANPSVYVKTIAEGVKRVREQKGKYAFIMESVHNDYNNNRKPCNTMKVGHHLNSNHYGIATKKESSLRDDITLAVLSLKEDGTLEGLKKKWWIDKGQCAFDTGHRESKKKSLSLSNVAGIYFILIGGLVFSIIVGVCEFIYIKSKPDRVPSGAVYMMPSGEMVEAMNDEIDAHSSSHFNHKSENGPASPLNGGTPHNNHNYHFSYETPPHILNPPKISFDMDANTSV